MSNGSKTLFYIETKEKQKTNDCLFKFNSENNLISGDIKMAIVLLKNNDMNFRYEAARI